MTMGSFAGDGSSMLGGRERAWWIREDPDQEDPLAYEKLNAVVNFIDRTQDRKRTWALFGAMYGGGVPPSGGNVDETIRSTPSTRSSMGLNVSRNVVDAVISRVFAKANPHLSYVTEGGDYEKQDNANKLELGVEGIFYKTGARKTFILGGRDGCVYGTGVTNVWADRLFKKIRIDRWRTWEYITDDSETLYEANGKQKTFFTKRYEDKYELAYRVAQGTYVTKREQQLVDEDSWAEKARHIERLSGVKADDAVFGFQQVAFRIPVTHGYRLPSGPDADDGRHVIGVQGKTILDVPWTPVDWEHPVPFAFWKWSEPIEGFYGQGIIEIGAPIQAEINKLVRQIQNGHHLITGQWLIEKGSKVVLSHINNDLSRLLAYTGTAPQYIVPGIIAPEVYQHLWNLVQKYYELSGINQQAAQAQKPAGLDSGEAQRVYADQQTETLLDKGQRFGYDYVRVAGHLATLAAKELAEDGAYEVRAMADDGFETIDWGELDEPDGFELVVKETSSLPLDPAAKIELANELMKLPGADFDGGDVLEMIGMPDILQKTRQKQSSRRWVEKVIGQMLKAGIPYEPDPMMNLVEAQIIARQMYCLAQKNGTVRDEWLELVRDFELKCTAMLAPPPMLPAAPVNAAAGLGPAALQAAATGNLPGAGGPPPAAPPAPPPQ